MGVAPHQISVLGALTADMLQPSHGLGVFRSEHFLANGAKIQESLGIWISIHKRNHLAHCVMHTIIKPNVSQELDLKSEVFFTDLADVNPETDTVLFSNLVHDKLKIKSLQKVLKDLAYFWFDFLDRSYKARRASYRGVFVYI